MLFITLLTLFFGISSVQSNCQRLAVCVLRKCAKVETPVTLNKKELLSGVLSQLNFACVFGPGCYDTCSECRECSLMQEKIRRAVLREVPDSKCQQMDDCVRSCIRDDEVDPYGCIFRDRCAPLCMEREGCQSCYSVIN
ncbi:hypothetical protein ANCDUO_05234 [Ancylostoma duodenale]|uniref:Uncharacterized protein n=1 Tax=Ancylostoma duodenale TaxID=51022 RepID=A0A0C2D4P4_9BILA|nr:hypothetical protein ANCDUO_05234 [Ancylostoma duodenale]